MYKKFLLRLFFLFQFFLLHHLEASKMDSEYWQYVNFTNIECGKFKLYTVGELRFNQDISTFYFAKFTECFAYQALPSLAFEAHYSYIYDKTPGATHFHYAHRLELEVNPSLELHKKFSIFWRNRLELIKRQHVSKILYVFRHRVQFRWDSFKYKNLGFTVSDEIFYNFDTHKFIQNRFRPIELNFKLNKFTLDVFLMLRNFFASNKWHRSIVIGTQLNI